MGAWTVVDEIEDVVPALLTAPAGGEAAPVAQLG
jgi:hypothetical protein